MKILGIDSSGLVASVAVATEEDLLGEFTICYKKTHSQTLLPMLDELAQMIELDLETIDAIAVASGPGSFTGLRIGSATVKGMALALEKPVIEVPTLYALAYNFCGQERIVCPLMDARRNQTYTALFRFDKTKIQALKEQCAVDIHEIIEEINGIGESVVFLGDGAPVFQQAIKEQLRVPYMFAPPCLSKQKAGSLASLAVQYYIEGNVIDAALHKPEYLRLSQAERERMEKEHASN